MIGLNYSGVRNSSPDFAGSPFGSANMCVSDFATLRPNLASTASDVR